MAAEQQTGDYFAKCMLQFADDAFGLAPKATQGGESKPAATPAAAGMKLLEIPEDLAATLVSGDILSIKGVGTEDVVLCTQSRTFNLQKVETSNTVLLCPGPRAGATAPASPAAAGEGADQGRTTRLVAGVVDHTLQLSDAVPRLRRVTELLGRKPLTEREAGGLDDGDDDDDDDENDDDIDGGQTETAAATLSLGGAAAAAAGAGEAAAPGSAEATELASRELFDMLALQRLVQASDDEIAEEVDRLGALEIDGNIRLLDPSYERHLIDCMLTTVAQNGWHLLEVPVAALVAEVLEQAPEVLVRHLLKRLGMPHPTEADLWSLSISRIARSRGHEILASQGTMPLERFSAVWQLLLDPLLEVTAPSKGWDGAGEAGGDIWLVEGFQPSLQRDLGGLHLVNTLQGTSVVLYVPESEMPADPAARFAALFQRRARWTYEELRPFISRLVGPGLTEGKLLVKFSRVTTQRDGSKLYSRR